MLSPGFFFKIFYFFQLHVDIENKGQDLMGPFLSVVLFQNIFPFGSS